MPRIGRHGVCGRGLRGEVLGLGLLLHSNVVVVAALVREAVQVVEALVLRGRGVGRGRLRRRERVDEGRGRRPSYPLWVPLRRGERVDARVPRGEGHGFPY